jgi:hypothetical protein
MGSVRVAMTNERMRAIMLTAIAVYNKDESSETLDLYEAEFDDGVSIDLWVPRGSMMSTANIHVEFKRDED